MDRMNFAVTFGLIIIFAKVPLSKSKAFLEEEFKCPIPAERRNFEETSGGTNFWKGVKGESFIRKANKGSLDGVTNFPFLEIGNSLQYFLMLYAPFCPYSIKAKNEFADAAKFSALSIKNPELNKIQFWAVDCYEFGQVCERFKIRGIPTFAYVKNGKYYILEGNPTVQKFLEFLKIAVSSAG